MTTLVIILISLALLAAIIAADLKALKWIESGGLKSWKRRFFLVYLPMAAWFFCFTAPSFMVSGEAAHYLRLPFSFLGAVYGIGFSLHYFVGRESFGAATSGQTRSILIGGFIILVMAFDFYSFMRFNDTPSMPRGVYALAPAEDRPRRGDLVTFCLEPNNPFTALAKERGYVGGGSCPSGMKPLLKKLAGLPGDELEIAPDGLILNGNFVHLSFRPPCDSLGREMPPSLLQNGIIPEAQALVLSQEHGNSFDSRHFGLMPLDSLTKVEPVLTFESESK
jgi:conjugative transfer signal peptidase TraF